MRSGGAGLGSLKLAVRRMLCLECGAAPGEPGVLSFAARELAGSLASLPGPPAPDRDVRNQTPVFCKNALS